MDADVDPTIVVAVMANEAGFQHEAHLWLLRLVTACRAVMSNKQYADALHIAGPAPCLKSSEGFWKRLDEFSQRKREAADDMGN